MDLSTGTVGNVYKVKLRAYNNAGYIDSSALSVALASLPSKPTLPPTADSAGTNQYQLKILINTFDSTNNGGSAILNYQIQYDDGYRGPYTSVYTLSPSITVTNSIVRGNIYRVRYRAQNFNGWGDFSDVGYIKAATTPSTPPAPLYYDSDSTMIILQFIPPTDNGGSTISGYKLWMDTIQAVDSFSIVYTGNSLQHTLTVLGDSLVAGTTYRFKLQASN